MYKTLTTFILLAGMSMFSSIAFAEPLTVKADDSIMSILSAQTGKRVTVRLDSGEELTGTVAATGSKVVQLGELSGKEYFDAVIDLQKITAVIIRTKE